MENSEITYRLLHGLHARIRDREAEHRQQQAHDEHAPGADHLLRQGRPRGQQTLTAPPGLALAFLNDIRGHGADQDKTNDRQRHQKRTVQQEQPP